MCTHSERGNQRWWACWRKLWPSLRCEAWESKEKVASEDKSPEEEEDCPGGQNCKVLLTLPVVTSCVTSSSGDSQFFDVTCTCRKVGGAGTCQLVYFTSWMCVIIDWCGQETLESRKSWIFVFRGWSSQTSMSTCQADEVSLALGGATYKWRISLSWFGHSTSPGLMELLCI